MPSVSRPAGAPRTRRSSWFRELSGFGVVGGLTFCVDVGLFQLLYAHLHVGAVTAKVVSTLVATTLAYLGHRFWSFSHRRQYRPTRQYLVFALINGATLALGAAIVAFVRYPLHQESVLVIQLANIASIALGTVIRYLSYRLWVFPAHRPNADRRNPGGAATAPA